MGFKQTNIKSVYNQSITLLKYSTLDIESRAVIDWTIKEYLISNNELRIGKIIFKPKKHDLWFLSWSDIIELRLAIVAGQMFDCLQIVYGINENNYQNLNVFNAFACYQWIVEKFKIIVEIEIQELSSELTEDQKNAGAEELQEFGYSVALDGIAKGDLLKYNDYLNLPYVKIFRKMCLDKKRYDINQAIIQNDNRKS